MATDDKVVRLPRLNGHGGKREGAGRPRGSCNRSVAQKAKEIAKEHSPDAMEYVAQVFRDEREATTVRLKAAMFIINHGKGRASLEPHHKSLGTHFDVDYQDRASERDYQLDIQEID